MAASNYIFLIGVFIMNAITNNECVALSQNEFMPITLDTAPLRAALHCVADKKDIRPHLQGVFVKIKTAPAESYYEPRALVAGCNGHLLFIGLSEVAANDSGHIFTDNPWVNYPLTIPVDAIKAIDTKARTVQLSRIDENTFRLGNTVFTPINGQYPDIARIVPTFDQIEKLELKQANFQPKYVMAAQKALQTYYGTKPNVTFEFNQFGDNSAIMHNGENCAQVLIMPVRTNGASLTLHAFNRDYF